MPTCTQISIGSTTCPIVTFKLVEMNTVDIQTDTMVNCRDTLPKDYLCTSVLLLKAHSNDLVKYIYSKYILIYDWYLSVKGTGYSWSRFHPF